jgi:hypothetical protein
MNKENAIQILERKRDALERELAITANPALKFELQEQIKEINARIDELKKRERDDDGPSAAPQVVPKGQGPIASLRFSAGSRPMTVVAG